MTEILLLGTFHFMEHPVDICLAETQTQLDAIVQKLKSFSPDAVAVEAAVSAQSQIDASYRQFQLSDLTDMDKMRNGTLGKITLYGNDWPITYNNEAVQIGYRLGKLLGHECVFAIDDDTLLDMETMQTPAPALRAAQQAFRSLDSMPPDRSLCGYLQHCNSENWSTLNHDIYMQANAVSTNNPYAGAEMVSRWYGRNLKIFSNIQRLAANYDRIFVLFGAGHLAILKSLIQADSNLKLADINTFL